MTTLHLIRHGQTNWNAERRIQGQSESELDDMGKLQAANRRPDIDALGITAIYSSSSVRTRQTTEILNQNLGLTVTHMDALREIYLGSWETRLWDDIHSEEPLAAASFHQRPHEFVKDDGENYQALRDRGVSAIEHIFKTESAGQVLVVSHGALIKAALSHYANVELDRLNDISALPNCSHSILSADTQGRRTLHSIASVALADTAWTQNQ